MAVEDDMHPKNTAQDTMNIYGVSRKKVSHAREELVIARAKIRITAIRTNTPSVP
jgi:hypothetical protein